MSGPAPNLWLKLKARQLIEACGGLAEASRVCGELGRAYSVTQLSRCQTPTAPDYLPVDVVMTLEAYCGQPIVSQAMAEARPGGVVAGDLRDELSDVVETGAALISRWRAVMADARLDRAERLEMTAGLDALAEQVREAQAALHNVEGGR